MKRLTAVKAIAWDALHYYVLFRLSVILTGSRLGVEETNSVSWFGTRLTLKDLARPTDLSQTDRIGGVMQSER